MKLTTVLLAALITLSAGAPSEERVSSGTAQTAPIPHLVSITVNDQHVCGGFIYNENWVVTAASCVADFTPSQVKVVVGQVSLIQLDVGEETLPVFKINIYETYDPVTKLHDIAMLQMANPITFSAQVGFIRYDEAEEVAGTTVEFAGWGGTTEGGLPSTKLRKISMTVPADCTAYGADFSANYMLCAGGSPVDVGSPCRYDEGSPLIQSLDGTTFYAIGIMSKNQGCATGFAPTVFTRLTSYYSWLNKFGGLQPAGV